MLVPLGVLSLVDHVTALQTRLPSLDSHLLLGTLCGALLMLMADHLLRFAFRRDRQNLLLAGLCALPSLLGLSGLWPDLSPLTNVALLSASLLGLFLYGYLLAARQRRTVHADFRASRAEAASQAEQEAKAKFLARISHEIRTPMNGVLGMTELLMGTPLSAKQRDYVQTIHSSGNELLQLLNEILDLSALESGEIELDDVQFDLPALLDECLETFRTRAELQGVELISFIQPQVPRTIGGDPARLRQTLLNLLDHAFKQTDEGEVLLVAALERGDSLPRLRIAVQDSGRPLSSEEREILLNTHLRSRDYLNESRLDGHLGLVLSRQLVTLMRGEFGIESGEQQGSTLWLNLPLSAASLAQPMLDPTLQLRDARVLVVDDNDTCRKVLIEQCSSWGLQASGVASGAEALALLRTKANLREYFDAVLLDHDMPGMSGMQLAAKIKEDPHINHDLLLVMLSGLSQAPSKLVARNAGISRILAKPVAGYTLKATLAEELGRQRRGLGGPGSLRATQPLVPEDFRVLVAEDNSISTKVIRGMLGKLDVEPDLVSNGRDALRALQRQRYDLVLMDCEMPVLDGFAATVQLRAWEAAQQHPRTPVVALTAHILGEHKERALRSGMDGHMAKPVELSQLRELVEHWVAVKEQRSRAAQAS
ncbi:response regulator [Pseudomonas sp. MAP12]|uniref:histidine kinase n=1 Tax=Geopseudomonas aromaticivorans TaxID=2849492 RepID=A0ABS6N2K4_9GAMM|nr:response regulator [Pseudomonas aromaticivorans]MBV2134846.1 response regulator [Pseudomonas aromaticivorans]